jgi:hypothetical protein
MADFEIARATRQKLRMRAAFQGPSGAGKTATALLTALGLVRHYGGKIGLIDTQNQQSLDYADTRFAPEGFYPTFLANGNPEALRNAILKYKHPDVSVLVIDSLSIAWAGEQGLLDQSAAMDLKDRFSGWNAIGKTQNKLLNTLASMPCHVIVTIQSKTEWYLDEEEREGGRKVRVPKKVGLAPVQRPGIEYLWPLYCTIDLQHRLTVERVNAFEEFDKAVFDKPDETWIKPYIEWMEKGVAETPIQYISRVATDTQVAEYYELAAKLKLNRTDVMLTCMEKYGFKPEDMAGEFIEERLTELREKTKNVK